MAVNHMRRLSAGATPLELVSLLGDTAKLMAAYAALFALGILL
jgi:1,4-dihydroxy-2-naphthoate octaprenyltransferase